MKKRNQNLSPISVLASYSLCLMMCFTLFSCETSTAPPDKGSGSAVFYTTSNGHGRIEITISGGKINPVSFTVPVTNNPDSYCANGWTGWVLLDVGTYNFKATAADGAQWSSTIDITKDVCLQRRLI